jgi:hypothetical protein
MFYCFSVIFSPIFSFFLTPFSSCSLSLFLFYSFFFLCSFMLPTVHNLTKLIFNISAECKCPPYAQCQRDENNFKKYKCVCPPTSTVDQSTVCGSNGRTYINRQVLERESCLFEVEITALYSGTCSEY